jgi:uncharacterized protein (TIGR02231 family)
MPVKQTAKMTSVKFSLDKLFTLPSSNKSKKVELARYEIPADYEYLAVPVITPNVFLTAYVKDWEKYNLLSGEAQVFIEGTAVGKTLLNVSNISDTLHLSLGVDRGVVVERRLKREFSKRRFLKNKKSESREWVITLKNNKSTPVKIRLLDQIPVSVNSDIKVEVLDLSGGKLDREKGFVEWKLELQPGEKKEVLLKYIVKYPKYRNLQVK